VAGLSDLQASGRSTTLFPWEDELAQRVGTGRTSENIEKSDRHSYDKTRLMDSNLLANIHAAVVEIGVSRIIGAYCYAAVWPLGQHNRYASELPDALRGTTEVEIKWRRTAKSMPVDRKDAEVNRLVLWAESKLATSYSCACSPLCGDPANRDFSKVRLLGGGYAADLWDAGISYNGDQNRVAVPAEALLRCENLGLWTLPPVSSAIP